MAPEADGPPVRVRVNGAHVTLPARSTVEALVAERCPDRRGVAVAVDREVIPRSSWAAVVLQEGAEVEIVTAAAGG